MLMTGTIESTIKHDHLLHLRRFLEQIELDEYYTLIIEKLKVRYRIKMKERKEKNEKEGRLKSISRSSLYSFLFFENVKKVMAHNRFDNISDLLKCQDDEKTDIRLVRKVTNH
jgi:hypothetical protein